MNEDQAKQAVYAGVNEIERVFGVADALDEVDAITAQLIVSYIQRRPALGKADRVALVAVAEVGRENPDFARQLMAELGE